MFATLGKIFIYIWIENERKANRIYRAPQKPIILLSSPRKEAENAIKIKIRYLRMDFNPIHIETTIRSNIDWGLIPKMIVSELENIAIKPEKKSISIKQNIILIGSLKISFTFLIIYPPKKNIEIKVVIRVGWILMIFVFGKT